MNKPLISWENVGRWAFTRASFSVISCFTSAINLAAFQCAAKRIAGPTVANLDDIVIAVEMHAIAGQV
ncbi:hypothetical protein [Cypionkella sp.]|uniref:hypothetical protein n=1 Tax=Cypionkella sp. TaxID=2811411 RepID=UPI0027190623|nr:hypothetical protein [Cypionkella sp.]MDO8984077.1 hypothetical protein [Cypionkella sp.]MDP2047751.1 hypothetical protein [Cypionkella sp.]